MDWINVILSGLGSIASILGFFITIRKEGEKRNLILYGAIFLLTISTSVLSYKYIKATNEKLEIEESEGVIYSLLTLLESNKDIYPDTYNSYKKTVIERIERADTLDGYERRKIIENSGNSAFQFLKSLSK
ncbi:MAG: hypothetical protein AB8H03_26580 [Saprospiraceae bacterium]